MWKLLSSKLDLDPPTPMLGQVYLGCGQHETVLDPAELEKAHVRFKYITSANTSDDETILHNLKEKVEAAAAAAIVADAHQPPSQHATGGKRRRRRK